MLGTEPLTPLVSLSVKLYFTAKLKISIHCNWYSRIGIGVLGITD
jgi:hypothetical protein